MSTRRLPGMENEAITDSERIDWIQEYRGAELRVFSADFQGSYALWSHQKEDRVPQDSLRDAIDRAMREDNW